MARQGRAICWQKVYLLASTGLVSIYTWGFNTWGEAFLIMNLFHALQYFGIVWASEHRTMQRTLRLERVRGGRVVTWLLFVGLAAGYGMAVEAWADGRSYLWWSITRTFGPAARSAWCSSRTRRGCSSRSRWSSCM